MVGQTGPPAPPRVKNSQMSIHRGMGRLTVPSRALNAAPVRADDDTFSIDGPGDDYQGKMKQTQKHTLMIPFM